jgi:hypothetical protein
MINSQQCLAKYGEPSSSSKFLVLWDVPAELEIGAIPKKIYCNKDMIEPLSKAFKALIETGYVKELKTYDGCFNIRLKRGGISYSLHSWAVAIDLNAFENQMGLRPKLSAGFVQCFTDAGFEWGGYWKTPDGMHFQLAKI